MTRVGAKPAGLVLLVVAATMTAIACSPVATTSTSPSPSPAPPDVVLGAYLNALVAGDCDAARKLWVVTNGHTPGELCGAVRVSAAKVRPGAATPSANEVVFVTTLTTSGSDDGTVPPGDIIWFFSLDRQADGSWRIVGGGSGP